MHVAPPLVDVVMVDSHYLSLEPVTHQPFIKSALVSVSFHNVSESISVSCIIYLVGLLFEQKAAFLGNTISKIDRKAHSFAYIHTYIKRFLSPLLLQYTTEALATTTTTAILLLQRMRRAATYTAATTTTTTTTTCYYYYYHYYCYY